MSQVYLSLGSNVNVISNICSCMQSLRHHFTDVISSKVYQTPAVGFVGDDFLNSVVSLTTDLNIDDLRICLRNIEDAHGRKRSKTEKFNSRTLDIDLLLYDDVVKREENYTLPHKDILKYAFVLQPLAELAPELIHPVLNKPMQQIARELNLKNQPMLEITLSSEKENSQ